MRRILLIFMLVFVCVSFAQAELITNGDFEDPNMTGGDVLTFAPGWGSTLSSDKIRMDDKGTLAKLPGPADNQAQRLRSDKAQGKGRQKDIGSGWTTDDVYTLTFNACEVGWQPGEGTQNELKVYIKDQNDGWEDLWSVTIDLDGTHDGNAQGDWLASQTFSYTIDADVDFASGMGTPGGKLVLQFEASVNQCHLDNVSLTVVPEPATVALLGLGGFVLRRRKR